MPRKLSSGASDDDKERARDIASRTRAETQRIGASKRAGRSAHTEATRVQKEVDARLLREEKGKGAPKKAEPKSDGKGKSSGK